MIVDIRLYEFPASHTDTELLELMMHGIGK